MLMLLGGMKGGGGELDRGEEGELVGEIGGRVKVLEMVMVGLVLLTEECESMG